MGEKRNERRCPRCHDAGLRLKDFVVEKVDPCLGCGGMFFEQGVLENPNLLVEDFFSVQLKEPQIENIPAMERGFKPDCPDCGTEMKPYQIGQVWIDRCPACRGLWEDEGEISALRISQLLIRQNLNLFLRLSQ